MSPSLTSKIPFLSSSHKDDGDKLHAVEEGKASLESSKEKSIDEKRKDSASITAPAKPTPARIPSTRIQEPTRTRSQMQRNPSQLDRHKSTTSTKTGGRPERPGLQRRRTTAQTRYIDMLLGLDNVPKLHNILASFFTWVLLAGYIVFPATFKKWQTDDDLEKKADNEAKAHALATARNIPLLYIAAFACGIGVLGCLWLWWVHRKNYVWVINRVFLPALMNSIAGLISTLINVYTAQAGQYSVTARATIIVTGICSTVTATLFLLYNCIMLMLVKKKHEKETQALERDQSVMDREAIVRREGEDGTGLV